MHGARAVNPGSCGANIGPLLPEEAGPVWRCIRLCRRVSVVSTWALRCVQLCRCLSEVLESAWSRSGSSKCVFVGTRPGSPRLRAVRGLSPAAKVLLGAAVALQGCSTLPGVRYYSLDTTGSPAPAGTVADSLVLKVERLVVAEPYAGRRLVYRPSPNELAFWEFHQWAGSPERMITDRVAERLARTGLFKSIDSFPYSWEKADLVLRGVVLAFEEVDKGDAWYGHVKLFLELVDSTAGLPVWSSKIDMESKALRRDPEALVGALSQALDEAVDRAALGMKEALR